MEPWLIIPSLPVAAALTGIVVMSVALVRRRLSKEEKH